MDWIERTAKAYPQLPALVIGGEVVSYARLHERTNSLCAQLESAGCTQRRGVLAAITASPRLLALLLHAAPRLGVALQPMSPALSCAMQTDLLRQSGAKWVVVDDARHVLPQGMPSFLSSTLLAGRACREPVSTRRVSSRLGVRLIIATSDSEGDPRGVMLSDASLRASTLASRKRILLLPADCWMLCLPLHHIGGLAVLLRCAEAGAAVIVRERFDAAEVLRELWEHKATHISLVSPMLAQLIDASEGKAPPPSLRAALIDGGPLSAVLAKRAHAAGWPLCVSYGMTESASQVATDCAVGAGLEAGVVGSPMRGFEIDIMNPDAEAYGHIRIRGPALMVGYANPEQTPGLGLHDGWYQTGDLGRINRDGQLQILGRVDDVLVSRGVNIHPAQVESLLAQCPGLIDVAVSARHDLVWGDRLVALIVGEVDSESVAQWSRDHLPAAMRPRQFIVVESIPRTPTAKIDRRALLEEIGNRSRPS